MSGTASTSFYVATTGDDIAGNGSQARPFATLARAQSAMQASATIKTTTIETGTYHLTSTLQLGPADSGETWLGNLASGPVVIDGGQVITGFTSVGNGVYAAQTAAVTTDLTLGGTRALAADSGFDPSQPFTTGWRVVDPMQTAGSGNVLLAEAADLTSAVAPGAVIQVIDSLRYTDQITTVTSVDAVNHTITLADPVIYGTDPGTSWRVLGAPSDLSLDNTFAYDQSSGTLLVKTADPSVLSGGVVAARLGTLISGYAASDVTIAGLTFADTTSPTGAYAGGAQAISLFNSINDSIVSDAFVNVGNGVYWHAVSNSTIASDSFSDVGGSAIVMDGGSNANTVQGDSFLGVGQVALGVTAIGVNDSSDDVVSGNLIDGSPRFGIDLGNASALTNDTVTGNTILHTNQQTNDAGPIYVYGGAAAGYAGSGLTISDNRIQSTGGLERLADGSYVAGSVNGVYLDDHVSGATVTGNVVEGARGNGVFSHGGSSNTIDNNVVILRPTLTFNDAVTGTAASTGNAFHSGSWSLPLLPGDVAPADPTSRIVVTASGASVGGVFATISVYADGVAIGTAQLGGALSQSVFMAALMPGHTHQISVFVVAPAGTDGSSAIADLQSIAVNDLLYGPDDRTGFGAHGGTQPSVGVGFQDDDLAFTHQTAQDNILYAPDPGHTGLAFDSYNHANYVDPNPGVIDTNLLFNAPGVRAINTGFATPVDAHAVTADPMFVEASVGDYRLQPGSPAFGVGFTAAGVPLAPPCFVAGTRIATVGGARAVETLTVGDHVSCKFAGRARIVWIGRRTVDCARHPDPRAVWPVRVRAGAFGATPERDLFLSPDHAVFVDGVLIPVKHLVDGDAVSRVERDFVTYLHVELAAHDVLLAEGLAVESYLDTGDRSRFGGGAIIDLHPSFQARERERGGCARLVVAGPELAAARALLQFYATSASRRSSAGDQMRRVAAPA